MALHLVIGYSERGPKAVPEVVYSGRDKDACTRALNAARNDPKYAEFHVLNNPPSYRKGSNLTDAQRAEAGEAAAPPVPVEEPVKEPEGTPPPKEPVPEDPVAEEPVEEPVEEELVEEPVRPPKGRKRR